MVKLAILHRAVNFNTLKPEKIPQIMSKILHHKINELPIFHRQFIDLAYTVGHLDA